jgi:hypothetical protein
MSTLPSNGGSPSGSPFSRWTVVLVVLAVTALLGLVAVASRGGRVNGGGTSEPVGVPGTILDVVLTVYLVFMALGGVLLVYVLFQDRLRARRRQPPSQLRRFVMMMLFVIGVSVSALLLARRLADDDEGPARATPVRAGEGRGSDEDARDAYRPQFRWAAAVGALVLIAGGAAWFLMAGRRDEEDASGGAAAALALVVDDSLDDLRSEPDARKAVVAAYARMETALAAHGFARRPAEAPLEYLSRILLALRVRAGAVFDLTELFERAKFSAHSIDASMKEDAIAALIAVRDDLRAS